jgi:uncharacterized protein YjdB
MVMTPATNQFGMVTVTVTATATSQISGITSIPHRYVFTVDVRRNNPPTIGNLPTSLVIGSDRKFEFDLDNIRSNNGETNQTMTITGLSSDQTILQNSQIVASYNGIALSGKLSITPIQFASPSLKTFNLTVNIRDNGGTAVGASDNTNYLIPVTVFPVFYAPPTIGVIPNQIDNIITQGPRTIRIEPITDGNGGSRISSITAVSGNTGILANPTISYTPGNNFALLTYNSLITGTTNISVTATNFGAPSNSNGNSSFTRSFVMTALDPPQTGYIEPFTVSTTVGAPENASQADGRSSTVPGTWFIEARNTIQTVTINTVTGTFTNVMNKPGTAGTGYFSGVWYKPRGGGDLFDFATYPYLSVQLSVNSPNVPSSVAIDLWDVNGIRYGLTSAVAINGTPTTYTFCYTGVPSAGFDFSKVKTILFNFGVTAYNNGTGSWEPFNGTIVMRDLRLGSSAIGSGSCSIPLSTVIIPPVQNPFYTTAQNGTKTFTITGINAGSTPISGKNNNPVNLSVGGSFSPVISSFNAATGVAVVQFTSPNTASTGVITLTGTASAANTTRRTFTVTVQNPPSNTNVIVTNDLTANMADGQKGQTIDGSPFGVCEIWGEDGGSNQTDEYYALLKETNIQSMRIGIWDFEPKNDNNDPNVLDKTKLDYRAMGVDFFKKAHDAGVQRFLVTFFSPPSFTKYNNSYGVPNAPFTLAPGFVVSNTVDSSYYDEYAEYALAFVQGVKEKSGVDIWGLCLGNEIQFNQTYQSVVFNTTQYTELVKRVGRRLAQAGLKTFLWGAETLQAQDSGNNYLKAIQADPEARNYFGMYAIHAYAANGVGQANPSWGNVVIDSRDTRSNGGLTLLRQSPIATVGPGGEPHNGNGGTGIPISMTETSQGGLATVADWDNALGVFGGVTSSMNVGNNSGWYYIGITKEFKMFYTYKHIDKFVFGGARRIPATEPSGTKVSAFRNPDNSIAIVAAADGTGIRNLSVGGANMPSTYKAYVSVDNDFWKDLGTVSGIVTLPPNSMITLWGGGNALVAANGVTVSGNNTTNIAGGSIQFTANVGPSTLVDKSVTWSVITNTGNAIIDQNGLMTAIANGTVTVRATSVATPTVFGQMVVTISGQYVKVTGITVDGQGGVSTINTSGGTLQMVVTNIAPITAPLSSAGWSLVPSSGVASIDASTGLLTALNNGLVTVIGTSLDNTTVTGRRVITITGQSTIVTSATITGAGGVNVITTSGGTLAMSFAYSPSNANTNTLPGWSIAPTFGVASIGTNGILTATGNGLVTVTGTFGLVTAIRVISISGQFVGIPVSSATIAGNGLSGLNRISISGGNLTVTGAYSPSNANTNTLVGWSANIPGGIATFNNGTGVLTASNNGNGVVTITGTYGSVTATRLISITGQFVSIPVTSVTISGGNSINTAGGSLVLTTGYLPSNANTGTLLGWTSTLNGIANFNNGTVTALNINNGVVTVTSSNGSLSSVRVINITNQNIPVVSATVTGSGTITVAGGSVNLTGAYSPVNANTNTLVGWSINDPSNIANFNAGLGTLQAKINGSVTITGTYGAVTARRVFTFTNQLTGLSVNGSSNNITVDRGTSTVNAVFTPAAASTTGVNWTLAVGSPGSISGTGVYQAITNGVATVVGTSALNSAISNTYLITVSNQVASFVSVTGLVLSTSGSTITSQGGTRTIVTQTITPANATNQLITWSTSNASVAQVPGLQSTSAVITATGNGVVTITGTSSNASVFQRLVFTVSGYPIPVTGMTLTSVGTTINTANGSLQMGVIFTPANANQGTTVGWSLQGANGSTSINPSTGLLQSGTNGNGVVTVVGNNGSLSAVRVVTITNQNIPVTSATVNGTGGVSVINTNGGTLTMTTIAYLPANANQNTTPVWSMAATTLASFNAGSGQLTAIGNGTVTITGTFGAVTATRLITISNQFVGIPVASATVTGAGNVNVISTAGGSLQMTAPYSPANANQNTVVGWSMFDPQSVASFNATTGVLTANNYGNGTVTITGTYGSVTSRRVVNISNQFIQVDGITVDGIGGVRTISTLNGTLQMVKTFNPTSPTNTSVVWSSNTNIVSIDNDGIVTALADGVVDITATATNPNTTSFSSTVSITITGQIIPLTSFSISGTNGVNSISVSGGTLQLVKTLTPANTTQSQVNWSSSNSAIATIDPTSGLVTAFDNGLVTITGISQFNSAVTATFVVSISGQLIPVTAISVTGTDITQNGATSQMNVIYTPTNTTYRDVTWSVTPSTNALINSVTGLLTPLRNGQVIVTATSNYDSNLQSFATIIISGQIIPVASLSLSTSANQSQISNLGSTLAITANILPSNANNKSVNWNVMPSDLASISGTGQLRALGYGIVTVTANSVSNSSVSGIKVITIGSPILNSITITTTATGSLMQIGDMKQFNVVVSPSNSFYQSVNWSLSNGNGTITSNGLFTALSSGEVTIFATSVDQPSITSSFVVSISGTPINNTITGTSTVLENETVSIYPNPTDREVTVEFTSAKARTLKVFDINGKIVIDNIASVSDKVVIDFSSLPKGSYTIGIYDSKTPTMRKVSYQ